MRILHLKDSTAHLTNDNVAMTQQLGNTLHIPRSYHLAHNSRANLLSIVAVLSNALKFEIMFLGNWHKALVVTLATSTQAVIIPHNHTLHTEPPDKTLNNEVSIWLLAKLFVKVCNNKVVYTL